MACTCPVGAFGPHAPFCTPIDHPEPKETRTMTEYTARVTVFADTDAEAIARVTDALSGHNLAFASIKPATSANLTSDEYSTLPVRVKVRDSTVAAFGTWEEAAEYAQNLVIGADDNSAEDVSISFSLVTV